MSREIHHITKGDLDYLLSCGELEYRDFTLKYTGKLLKRKKYQCYGKVIVK